LERSANAIARTGSDYARDFIAVTGQKADALGDAQRSREEAYAADIQIRLADEKLPPEGVAVLVTEFDRDGMIYENNGVKVIAFEVDHGDVIKPAYGLSH